MLKSVRVNNKKFFIGIIGLILLFSVLNIATVAEENRPDLTLEIDQTVINNLDNLIEGENVKIPVKIKNVGDKNISGETIGVALKIDGVIVAQNATNEELPKDTSRFVNLSWTPTYEYTGENLHLSIHVDYEQEIAESNENNNVWDKYVNIAEGDTIISIVSVYYNGMPMAGNTIKIYADITNIGRDTEDQIFVTLNDLAAGQIQNVTKDDGLERNETFPFVFNWTPSNFGMQNLEIEVTHNEKVHDSVEFQIYVDIESLPWWDGNWHYRHLVTLDGAGNISLDFNFTEMLNDSLGVSSQKFENNTISIIQYTSGGGFSEPAEFFCFNESLGFNNMTNATGTLTWNVTGPGEKYYCIYFDVESNIGNRTNRLDTNMTSSGDVSLNSSGFIGGWWGKITAPANQSYHLVNTPMDVLVDTVAKASNVTAEFFLNNTKIKTVYLSNQSGNMSWNKTVDFLNKTGEYKIVVNCSDIAGYQADSIEHVFYVNMPDIKPTDISFSTDCPHTSPTVYKDDAVKITSTILCYNASVDNVNITLTIFNVDTNQTFNFAATKNLVINTDNIVDFYWLANQTGTFNVTITADPGNLINESNEANNIITKTLTVNYCPDLEVERITLPSEEIMEGDNVTINVKIRNNAPVKATDYEAILFIEPAEQNIMKYENKISSKLFSIEGNTSKTISLVWDNADSGEWLVGVIVNVTDTKWDANLDNNRLLCDKTLNVTSIPRTRPSISEVSTQPEYQQQGIPVTITAKISDDSGLDFVTIKIKNPDDKNTTYNMVRISANSFSFKFEDTQILGTYTFTIQTKGLSIYSTLTTFNGNFYIVEDSTEPVIQYYDAQPYVQLKDDDVEIICMATDNVGIKEVRLTIETPSGDSYSKSMQWSSSGKYVYKDSFDTIGKYSFYVEVEDIDGNFADTKDDMKTFWITSDIDDTDNDGMPDWWEEKYRLDPEDSSDAKNDDDCDGYTNLKEYQNDFNPKKDIFMQNVVQRVNDNVAYLIGSVIIFVAIILLGFYGKRRRIL